LHELAAEKDALMVIVDEATGAGAVPTVTVTRKDGL
jgi:hypothetical protein